MGAESVEYHRATVLERGDDHPGMALEYYASRGETPLVWGGSGGGVARPGGGGLGRELRGPLRAGRGHGPPDRRAAGADAAGRAWRSSSRPTRAWPSSG